MDRRMSVVTGQVTVSTTPTLIVDARSRNFVGGVQMGTNDVWLGGPTVTPTTGLFMLGTPGTPFNWQGSEAIYGVTLSGTSVVSYAESF
jgi:hypothetical protein